MTAGVSVPHQSPRERRDDDCQTVLPPHYAVSGGLPRAGWAMLAAIGLCLALQAWLALVTEFNWDEFFYLSHLYSFERGELAAAFQMFPVHLLGWLTSVPGDEIDQLVVGRLVMLLGEAASCAFIYRLARAFFDPMPSLLAVLAFASAGFTMIHGASFRADPLATALVMGSLATLARGRADAVAAFIVAVGAAVAALVTIKVIFYAPAFAGIAAWQISKAPNRRRMLVWLGTTALAATALFALLYILHLLSFPRANNPAASAALGDAGRTTVLEAGLLPRSREIVAAAVKAPGQTVMMLFGAAGLGIAAVRARGSARLRGMAILGCAAPLLSLLFYRNAFPYFFPFITAPASLLVAWASQQTPLLKARVLLFGAAFTLPAIAVATFWTRERPQTYQRQLVAAVHDIFPHPVRYIDRNGMIASFPKRGPFMSTWGMLNYRNGPPIFASLLARETVPLLILNSPSLEHAVDARRAISPALMLQEDDRRTLQQNYIPHWGPIWVAGQVVRPGPRGKTITIAVPGPYTIEGARITIDGQPANKEAIVELARGRHVVRARDDNVVTLRWGRTLDRPAPMPAAPVFRGF